MAYKIPWISYVLAPITTTIWSKKHKEEKGEEVEAKISLDNIEWLHNNGLMNDEEYSEAIELIKEGRSDEIILTDKQESAVKNKTTNGLEKFWEDLSGQTNVDKTNETNLEMTEDTNEKNLEIAKDTNAVNERIAMQNLAFQKEQLEYQKGLQQQIFNREDTAYKRTLKDMQSVGLSPLAMNSLDGTGQEVSTTAPQNGFVAQQPTPMVAPQFQSNPNGVMNGISQVMGAVSMASGLFKGIQGMAIEGMDANQRKRLNDIQLNLAENEAEFLNTFYHGSKSAYELDSLKQQLANGSSIAEQQNQTRMQIAEFDNETKTQNLATQIQATHSENEADRKLEEERIAKQYEIDLARLRLSNREIDFKYKQLDTEQKMLADKILSQETMQKRALSQDKEQFEEELRLEVERLTQDWKKFKRTQLYNYISMVLGNANDLYRSYSIQHANDGKLKKVNLINTLRNWD